MRPSLPSPGRCPPPFPAVRPPLLPGALALTLAVAFPAAIPAQVAREPVDLAVVRRIREEGLGRSYIEGLARWLTEVNGPRLTGSPGLKRAEEWVAAQLRGWGLENVRIEPWGEFGRGWQAEAYAGRILTPFEQPLHAQPLAWTGSTPGTVRGRALVVEVAAVPDVERYRGRMKDAFLLLDAPQATPPEFEHLERRTPLEDLLAPAPPSRPGTPVPEAERQAMMARLQALRDAQRALERAALEEGAHAIFRISSRGNGVIRGGSAGSRAPGDPEGLPQLALPREQYNRIWRNVEAGIPVELELMVESRFLEDDLSASNTLADLPGTDKADEYVMLGAHLDSWPMGEGATDNAAGTVVMMEAMRILASLDLRPRRTIRIALWSGEEQGLLGSRGWVAGHAELHGRISAYLNLDNGTGRIRGIWDQSNEKATPVFEQILQPFRDLGVVAVRHGDTGGSDHLAFDAAGIPGFNFIQDPIEYGITTHHTELDTFDHLVLEDLEQAAVVVASTAYALAMREEMMPRKERPADPGVRSGAAAVPERGAAPAGLHDGCRAAARVGPTPRSRIDPDGLLGENPREAPCSPEDRPFPFALRVDERFRRYGKGGEIPPSAPLFEAEVGFPDDEEHVQVAANPPGIPGVGPEVPDPGETTVTARGGARPLRERVVHRGPVRPPENGRIR